MFVCRWILILLSFVVSLQCAPVPRPQTALTTTSNTLEFTFFPATEAQTATPTTQSRLTTTTTTTQVPLFTGLVTTSTALNTSLPPAPETTGTTISPPAPETTSTTISPPAPETTSVAISPPPSLKTSPGTPLVTFGELTIPSQGGTFDDFMVSGTTESDADSTPKNRHPKKKTSKAKGSKAKGSKAKESKAKGSKTKARRFFPSLFDSERSLDRFDVPSGLSKIPPPFTSEDRLALAPLNAFQNRPSSFPLDVTPSGVPEGNEENGQSTEGDSQQDLPVVPFDSNATDASSRTQALDDASTGDDTSTEDDQ